MFIWCYKMGCVMSKLTAALSEVKIQKNKGGRQSTSNCHMSQVKQIKCSYVKLARCSSSNDIYIVRFLVGGHMAGTSRGRGRGRGGKEAGRCSRRRLQKSCPFIAITGLKLCTLRVSNQSFKWSRTRYKMYLFLSPVKSDGSKAIRSSND